MLVNKNNLFNVNKKIFLTPKFSSGTLMCCNGDYNWLCVWPLLWGVYWSKSNTIRCNDPCCNPLSQWNPGFRGELYCVFVRKVLRDSTGRLCGNEWFPWQQELVLKGCLEEWWHYASSSGEKQQFYPTTSGENQMQILF